MKQLQITPTTELSQHFINVKPAVDFLPEWYKKSNGTIKNATTALDPTHPSATTATYKKCMPFFDAMTAGYIVYLSADIEITKTQDNFPRVLCSTQRTIITHHTIPQWEGLNVSSDDYYMWLLKWHNDLRINTPTNYSLLFTQPFNRLDLPFTTLSGIVDTDVYDLTVHFPFFIKKDFVGVIEQGTPITQIIPIKRENWKMSHSNFVPNQHKINMDKFRSTIKRAYKKNYWHRKQYS